MTFETLESELLDHFPELSDRGLIKRSANRVIRDLNQIIRGIEETERAVTFLGSLVNSNYSWTQSPAQSTEYYLTDSDGADPELDEPTNVWEKADDVDTTTEMTEGTVGSLSAGEWDYGDNDSLGYSTLYVRLTAGGDPDSQDDDYIKAYDVATGYTFDDATKILTLSDTLKELRWVYIDEDELTSQSYDYVSDSENTDKKVYYTWSFTEILLPSALLSTGEKLRIQYLRMLQEVSSTALSTVLDIPVLMKQAFLAGVHADIATMPQYRDENIFELYNSRWQTSLIALDGQVLDRMPFPDRNLDYLY